MTKLQKGLEKMKHQTEQQRRVGRQMMTEYKKFLAQGHVPSMEEVVIATATTIGEMGVGPNERDVLCDEIGKSSDFMEKMETEMATKGTEERKKLYSKKGYNNKLHWPVATPSPILKKGPPVASLPKSSPGCMTYQGESDYTHSSEDSFGPGKKRRTASSKTEAEQLRLDCIAILGRACRDPTNLDKTRDADICMMLSKKGSWAFDVCYSQESQESANSTVATLRAIADCQSGNE